MNRAILVACLAAPLSGCDKRPRDTGTTPYSQIDTTDGQVDGPDPTLECLDTIETPVPQGTCITAEITCDSITEGNSHEGTRHFGSNAGEQFGTCAGSASQTGRLIGPERVYKLEVPPNIRALHVELDTCQEGWLFWYQGTECTIGEALCSYASKGTFFQQYDDILLGESDTIYFVIENNDDNGGGNYRLYVECFE